ncbi:MAG: hypothetical protein NXI32_15245 [bacterium]|nr:hypothetical protein [bacterium]
MLREFHGVINATGLCSFGQDGSWHSGACDGSRLSIWAIIEESKATEVIRELVGGHRQQALRLLEELATSLGTELE